jgi:hypothetical protein
MRNIELSALSATMVFVQQKFVVFHKSWTKGMVGRIGITGMERNVLIVAGCCRLN